MQNDILDSLDNQQVAILLLLDLSAAFDTVDHQILLHRLETDFVVRGKALAWFESYLTGRSQAVCVNEETSEPQVLALGVPQGSVLGPKAFGIYMKPLGSIIGQNKILYHFYADDSQIYVTSKFDKHHISAAVGSIEECIENIRVWMRKNMLKLNDSKTEVIVFGTKQKLRGMEKIKIRIGDADIFPKPVVRNLGAYFDETMSMEHHIRRLSRTVHMHLRNISRVRKYLSQEATQLLVHALVISRIDYANSLLAGITSERIQRLQRLQNICARIITLTPKHAHITPVLKQLHWLPVEQRIEFKFLLHIYKALNGMSPSYIREMFELYQPARSLRSKDKCLIKRPPSVSATYGNRKFGYVAALLWNGLPYDIKTSQTIDCFKNRLKTHLFRKAYN